MERILYEDAARKFAKNWNRDVNNHIIDVMASVMMTRDGILTGGSFAQAVVNNDLYSAVTRADSEVLLELKLITLTHKQAFLQNLINQSDYETSK